LRGVKVLDSWALLAYFEKEPGCDQVTQFLKQAAEEEKDLLISVINWGEVLYVIERKHGKEKRDAIDHLMTQMHLEIVDADQELTREAAHLKVNAKLSYADSFAAALAKIRKAILITGDKDFRGLENQIKINWL